MLLFTGCGAYSRIEGQDQAEAIVWCDTFHSHDAPPAVEWFEPNRLNCAEKNGFYRDVYYGGPTSDKCVRGVFWEIHYLAQVAHPADTSLGLTGFYAHELAHAFLYKRDGTGHPDHDDPMFYPGGAVDQANAALREEGL